MSRFVNTTTRTLETDPKITGLEDVVIGDTGPSVPGSDLMDDPSGLEEEEMLQTRPSPVDSFDFKGAGFDIGGGLFDMEEEEMQTRPAEFETLAKCPDDPLGPLGYGCDPLDPTNPPAPEFDGMMV